MCGITALYHKNQAPINETVLKEMTQLMTHRGPDDFGSHIDHHIGLGFRRLSIIDLETGEQPLTNETGDIWLIGNGEIYNYKELQTWLTQRGHQFHTQSDMETVVHLYEEIGPDCPKHLRGMFGFVIWDRREQRLFGARDHFGIKPVYWAENGDGFAFASEIKTLLHWDDTFRKVNPTSFYHYLTFQYVPEPETMFEGIHKLTPGHTFIVQDDQIRIEPYWTVEFTPDESRSFDDFVEGTRNILKDSVDKHRISDVPRGAFLSSGVDSSSIVALLRHQENVKTFSVGFDIPGFSELSYARETARYLETEHYDTEIDANRYLQELPRLVWHQDEPVADPSAVALYFVAELASQYVTVVLSGEGADEFFGGYNIYREPQSLKMFSYMPQWLKRSLGTFAEQLPSGVKGRNFFIRGSKSVEERFFGNALIFSEDMKREMIRSDENAAYESPRSLTGRFYENAQGYDDVLKMQYLDIHTWLRGNILMKADKMTMANSLELRVPFIDPDVFEFAASIPTKYKIADGTTKHVLREAMKDELPRDVQRRKKLGFPVPTRHWLKNEFYEWARTLITESHIDQWLDRTLVLNMLEQHKEGQADHGRKIWTILIFILWHRIFIEQKHEFGPYVSEHVKKRSQERRKMTG